MNRLKDQTLFSEFQIPIIAYFFGTFVLCSNKVNVII